MTAWGELRPGHFDRTRLGKREPAPGLFGESQARQMPGQGDLLDDTAPGDDAPETGSDCLDFQ
jgi:hypothetical protein